MHLEIGIHLNLGGASFAKVVMILKYIHLL
jgi:hypothetical protein